MGLFGGGEKKQAAELPAVPRSSPSGPAALSIVGAGNLTFDRDITDEKRREARNSVRPVLFKLKRGEMVARVGERITEEQALKLEKMFEARHGINSLFVGGGIFGLVLMYSAWSPWASVTSLSPRSAHAAFSQASISG